MREKNAFRLTVYMSALFLRTSGYENDELHKKCSSEELNFDCSNLVLNFANHPWRAKHWQHHCFISKAKSSNILSMPKHTGSTFGLPPQIDSVTSKCWNAILWFSLLAPDTNAVDNPSWWIFTFWRTLLQRESITLFSSFIFPSYSFLPWIDKSAFGLTGVSVGSKSSYFFFPFLFFVFFFFFLVFVSLPYVFFVCLKVP